jgi:hypothetical protein
VLKKLIGLVTASLMAIVGLVSIPIAIAPAQAAPPASAFDPGLIISDSVFFDFGSMTVADIQQFLDSRVSACRSTDPAIRASRVRFQRLQPLLQPKLDLVRLFQQTPLPVLPRLSMRLRSPVESIQKF